MLSELKGNDASNESSDNESGDLSGSGASSSGSSYTNYRYIPNRCSFDNYMENFSNAQHSMLPDFIQQGKGYNYYTSIPKPAWDAALEPKWISRSFQSNDADFIYSVKAQELLFKIR